MPEKGLDSSREDRPESKSPELDYFREKQRDHEERLKLIEERVKLLSGKIEQAFGLSRLNPKQGVPTASDTKQYPQAETGFKRFCNMYNAGIQSEAHRANFRATYQTIRIGVTNIMERRRDSNLVPIFKTANDGDYYATQIEKYGRKIFVVVPRFDLTLQDSSYGPGAMGFVFTCPNYKPGLQYRRVKVIEPAIFEADTGHNWTLKEKGVLELGHGE